MHTIKDNPILVHEGAGGSKLGEKAKNYSVRLSLPSPFRLFGDRRISKGAVGVKERLCR